ncbi:hypothetical protein GF342_00410 [Candidatus Woesearchaeota archaeon]|nr:hypothetical protein [Candidatus Woesearchaeota archaeon]
MKFLAIGDLHGAIPKIHFKNFQAVIAPGDFCSDAPRQYMFQALQYNLSHPTKKEKQWYDIVGKRKAKAMIEQSLADGRVIVERLNALNVPVYVVPGNWDWTPKDDSDWHYYRKHHWTALLEGLENIIDCHHRLVDAGTFDIIGHGIISGPEYPQHKKDQQQLTAKQRKEKRREYDRQYRKLDRLFQQSQKPVLFISHNVPYGTPFDKINNPSSPRDGEHVGSVLARRMSLKYSPLLGIAGHMHEYFGKCRLGKTTWIDTGFGSDVNVAIDAAPRKIRKIVFKGNTAV